MANAGKDLVVKVDSVEHTDMAYAYHDFYKSNGGTYVVHTEGPSLTRQEFAEECDINTIMKRYEGHDIGSIMRRDMEPQYADFSSMPTNLLDYMTLMQDAERSFMTLPANVRREFDNSAMHFVEFASDPKNLDQMRAWGLAPPAKAPEKPAEPVSAAGASPPPSASSAPGGAGGPSTHGST